MSSTTGKMPSVVLWLAVIVTLLLAPSVSAQSTYKTLHIFNGKNGDAPQSGLIFDSAGNLYGTTFVGGHYNYGTVFKLTRSSKGGWVENVLYSFCRHCNNGGFAPIAGLTWDSAGNLYGTAALGGVNGGGTAFKLTPTPDGTWTESVLYSFCSLTNCADGDNVEAGLTFDAAGNLYGATEGGGALGGGTVFKLTLQSNGIWTENVLYSFCGLTDTCAAGSNPIANLVFDAAGNLYGTTAFGGLSAKCASNGCGVVFELSPQENGSWTENVLHTFNGRDGASFPSALVLDSAGNLYGTTAMGGNLSRCDIAAGNGCGVIFQLTPNWDGSWTENVLHRFLGQGDGSEPLGNLIFDSAGNLYGTTSSGGLSCECGVVFKLAPNSGGVWTETSLYRFLDGPGFHPLGGLTLDATGNLYGTTQGDLKTTFGSVFEVTQ